MCDCGIGWFFNVQILSVVSCVTTVCCAFSLCALVVRYDCWRVRPHTIIHVILSALLLIAGNADGIILSLAAFAGWRFDISHTAGVRLGL